MSENAYIANLFPEDCSQAQKKRPTTAAFKIKTSITALTDAINKCFPHYIRCIKPNDKKARDNWDSSTFNILFFTFYIWKLLVISLNPFSGLCKHQVRYLGLLENVKVRRAGYAYRAEYARFFFRYRVCSHSTWPSWSGNHVDGAKKIISEVVQDQRF